jgi:hypothetical protein
MGDYMKLSKSDVGSLVGISVMVVIFIFGVLNAIKMIDYVTFYTTTYTLLRDTNNCGLVVDKDKVKNSDMSGSQLEGFNDAVEKWNLVCSLKGGK